MADPYPRWTFFPNHTPKPDWATDVIRAFSDARSQIDSLTNSGVSSDDALAALRPALEGIGFTVETGKRSSDKIRRPVLFGSEGKEVVSYEVDAFHPEYRAVIEVEAGRGAANNADYRDLVRASLMVGTDYLVLAMMLEYRSGSGIWRSYDRAHNSLDAIYKSERLDLPLRGVLLLGY